MVIIALCKSYFVYCARCKCCVVYFMLVGVIYKELLVEVFFLDDISVRDITPMSNTLSSRATDTLRNSSSLEISKYLLKFIQLLK